MNCSYTPIWPLDDESRHVSVAFEVRPNSQVALPTAKKMWAVRYCPYLAVGTINNQEGCSLKRHMENDTE